MNDGRRVSAEIRLSDAAIRSAMASHVDEVRDARYPLKLRFNTRRNGGSWHLVTYQNGTAKWRKVGEWPANSAKAMIDELPRLTMESRNGEATAIGTWSNCGGVLRWYRDRALADRSLSDKRKENIKCSIDKHLLPLLGNIALDGIGRKELDEFLLWPLQRNYTLGTVRQHFAVLKKAFKQASVLRCIADDPLAGIRFSDFTDATIKPKGSSLQPKDLPMVLDAIAAAEPKEAMLLFIMLALGTRIGETRHLQWQYFDIAGKRLIIPADITKTRVEHVLPLSDWMIAVLRWYREEVAGNWLFPSVNIKAAMGSRIASASVKSVSKGDWTAHDLRKLARTCWADLGVDYMVAEQLLNHSMTKLDKAYIHTYMETQKRAAIELWHQHLIGINNPFKTKIIPRCTFKGDAVKAA